ncbi:hypothetical protein HK105_205978 [Polyrhizophydium stewartii]|uniref:Acetyl-CoA transporter n=1 Tax=Polyrhizophydium stewartii TaxID=2732419 RepID=A0ABR4N4D9_9FUNG
MESRQRRTSEGREALLGREPDDVPSDSGSEDVPLAGPAAGKADAAAAAPAARRVPLSRDYGNIALLALLYLLQGVPLGLSMGSVPFLLKAKLGYGDLALFSLSSYPYSLKLLWSPIVDSTFIKSLGRRKSWIVPIQAILGITLIVLGSRIDGMLAQDKIPVGTLAIVFTAMVLLCATQDIAVDGWALTLLHEDNKTYASTAQTIGLNTGYFMSFTIFLALNSPELCNRYLRSTPLDVGIIQLGPFIQFWGIIFMICNAWLVFFQKETSDFSDVDDIKEVYKTMARICMMPQMKEFIVVMLVAKLGFMANDAITGLKLLERGFSKEDLALAVLIDFPLQIVFGYYAAKWSAGRRPLRPWLFAFYGRLLAAVLGMAMVYYTPSTGVTPSFFAVVIAGIVFSSFMSTLQFVSMGSFFTRISDPAIGGTYMTLLNTLSNLGGTWPKYFIFAAVDLFTDAPCSVADATSGATIKCLDEPAKERCAALGGTCEMRADGYYAVNIACVVVGLATLLFFIKPTISKLEVLPARTWRLVHGKSKGEE